MPSEKHEESVGEATGEFTPDHADNAGAENAGQSIKDDTEPLVDEAAGEATGAYAPDASDTRAPGAPTRSPEEKFVQKTGGWTVDFDKASAADPSEATGAFIVDQEQSVKNVTGLNMTGQNVTGLRSVANVTAAASLGAFPAPEPARRTGRYFLKNFHAKGGMGEIWMAVDGDIGRPVALKRMLKGREHHREQFIKEAQVTGQLEHPGVVPVHELGVDENGQPYYVMKFIQGRTLGDAVKEYHGSADSKELRLHRLLSVFVNLCQTVAYAHSRGVIHRDLKPDNVMVGAYGETLVLDWGLAKVVGAAEESSDPFGKIQLSNTDDTMATVDGSIKGTPAYFAPEMAEGQVDNIDQLSDVYLLGSVLYSILTGRAPRHAKKMKELLALARTKPPDPPRQINPDVSKPLNAICVKALAHDKKDRYPSAAALAEEVQRYLAGEPVSAYRETFTERAWRWINKHRKTINRVAAALVVLGTIVAAFLVVREAERRRAEAQRIADEAQRDADRLKKEDQARQEINSFRDRAEEARYYAAKAAPMTENSEFFDLSKAENTAQEALAVAELWGPDLADLALEAQRPQLKKEIYDLLVEAAQLKTLKPGAEPAQQALALLERAAPLRDPTRGFHRLRAHCLKLLDKDDKGKLDAEQAAKATVPVTALDIYLQAEQLRHESLTPGHESADFKAKDGKDTKKTSRVRRDLLLRAIAEYRKALALDPEHYWSLFQLGACYMGLGKNAEAVEALGACVAVRPQAPWSYGARALALSRLGQYDDAEADLKKAMELDPEALTARLNRGAVYLEQKKYDLALADLNAVLDAPPGKRLLEAAFSRGQLHMYRNEPKKALDDFNLVIKHQLNLRNVHLWRARIQLDEGNGRECVEDLKAYFTGGQAAAAGDAKLYEQIARELRVLAGELRLDNQKAREAAYRLILNQLDKAMKLGAESPGLLFEVGAAEELLAGLLLQTNPQDNRQQAVRRFLTAISAYTKGIELDPKHVRLLVKRGWTYVNTGQNELARKDFAAAIAVEPRHAEAHTGLGYVLASLKPPDPVAARHHANLALLWGGGDYVVVHNVACIFAVLGDTEPPRTKEFHDLVFEQLRRALALWEEGGRTEPNELRLIAGESAFTETLRDRPEFKELLEAK